MNLFRKYFSVLFLFFLLSSLTSCEKDKILVDENTDDDPIITIAPKIAVNSTQFRNYLSSAEPGGTIIISGKIVVDEGAIVTSKHGKADSCVTIRGINNGTLEFSSNTDRACLTIKHDYYRIENFTIDANAQSKRGLLLENACHGIARNITVKNTLNEGFKIRKNSQYWLFDSCVSEFTGRAGEYGEGFYCGDATSNWTTGNSADQTGYITFYKCLAKPHADGFDCKEGTHHIKIINCTVDWNSGDVDPKFGNNGIYSRAENIQVINCNIKNNTRGTGNCVWASRKQAKDGNWYGSMIEIKKLNGYNMARYVYRSMTPSMTLYTDYTISQCAGVKDPNSEETAISGNPSDFVEMTWNGEGGDIFSAEHIR
ncbi:hypothetical protein JXA70_04385 [candidate division KSB1 bacterium]|nr:hypothetical protein [candidate division KSB1 bacterium]